MDLINDLSSDLAFAVLVEKRHQQKIDLREAKSLIARVESELLSRERQRSASREEASAANLSH